MFNNLSLRQKIIGAIIAIGLILIAIFQNGLYHIPQNSTAASSNLVQKTPDNSHPQLLSTKPEDGAIIKPDQIIELAFDQPIENKGEVKHTLTPKIDYNLDLTSDRKTIKLAPVKTFELGQSYTLTIKQDTKFDNGKRLDHDIIYHFNTIAYSGV
ncbi:Ig-like domain-containing protein [Candidatus Daviesbacteria bacterium]|nr:Ig-like domain-containing protein [Candidatus Daviesbacteria bacterium]